MTCTSGSPVLTPLGPGTLSIDDGDGWHVVLADGGRSAWVPTADIRAMPAHVVTAEEAVAAERKQIAGWLEEDIKALNAMGQVEARDRLLAIKKRILEGV